MEKDTITKLLDRIDIPDPDPSAKDRALKAAKDEYLRLEEIKQKKSKGISIIGRLKNKIQKGGPIMRKPFAIGAGFTAVFVATLLMMIMPNFLSYRSKRLVIPRTYDPTKHEVPLPQTPSKSADVPPLPFFTSDELLSKGKSEGDAQKAQTPYRIAEQLKSDMVIPKMDIEKPPADTFIALSDQANTPEAHFRMAEAPSAMTSEIVITANRNAGLESERMPIPDQTYVGRDQFEILSPNPVKRVTESPVSTFSIDVDTASYAFIRRALNNGVLPQKDAVRIEELINYFDYDYPVPSDKSIPFKPTVAVFPTPWNPDTKLLQIGIRSYETVSEKKPISHLVFLLDVSGSMNNPDKLPLLKNAFRMLVETLNPEDTVGIVVYAGAAGTVLEPTKAVEKNKILAALDRLRAGGSTAGSEGIRQAYAMAEMNFNPDHINRVILATDGDFNVGIRNPEELKGFVERKRETGIYLSVLGFGQGNYNDALMQKLAQNGNGNAAYIDNLNEARKVLVDEAASTLFTVAKDVKIQIEFNPSTVEEYRLIGYETRLLKREDFNNDRVDAGDIGSGHRVTAIYEFVPVGSNAQLIDDLRYAKQNTMDRSVNDNKDTEYAFLKIRYKEPVSTTSKLITTPISPNDEYAKIRQVPEDFRFSASVAAFGQLLRGDSYTGNFTYDDIISLAEPARGKDRFGYRTEFLNLVRLAKTARTMGDR